MKMIQNAAAIALFFVLNFTFVEASVVRSARSGNWNNTNTWVGSAVPQANDTIMVMSGHNVNVNGNYPSSSSSFRAVQVLGTLTFQNGQKLNIRDNGSFELITGGLLTGGNGGSRIEFVTGTNQAVYNIIGSFNQSGPMYATGSTSGFVVGALPVEWLQVGAEVNGQQALVSWSTASETQTSHFEVEKSTDGKNWVLVSSVGAAGNSQQVQNYSAMVSGLQQGVTYFRIKQIDLNGQYSYSELFTAEVVAAVEVKAYPNPTTGVLNVAVGVEGGVKVVVRNAFGQEVKAETSAEKEVKLDLSGFQTGVYHVQIVAGGQVIEKKIVKQ